LQPKFEATRRLVEPPSREGAGTPEGGPPRESDAVQIGKPRDPVSGTDERQEPCEQDATQHSQADKAKNIRRRQHQSQAEWYWQDGHSPHSEGGYNAPSVARRSKIPVLAALVFRRRALSKCPRAEYLRLFSRRVLQRPSVQVVSKKCRWDRYPLDRFEGCPFFSPPSSR